MISGVLPVTLRLFSAALLLLVLAFQVMTLACRGPEQTAPASPAPVPQPTIQPAHSPAALQTPTPAAATSYTPTPGPAPSPTPTAAGRPTPTPFGRLLIPTATPEIYGSQRFPGFGTTTDLEERILFSDVIVRAQLRQISAITITVPSADAGVAPTYRPGMRLEFKAVDFLKGSGNDDLIIEITLNSTSLSSKDALEAAQRAFVKRHNPKWDLTEAVIFLQRLPDDGPDVKYRFAQPPGFYDHNYSIESLNKVWLPAKDDGTAAGAEPVFLLSSKPADEETAPPVISYDELKSRIGEVEKLLADNIQIEGYERCVQARFHAERIKREQEELTGEPYSPPVHVLTFKTGSGLPAGTSVHSYALHIAGEPDLYELSDMAAGKFDISVRVTERTPNSVRYIVDFTTTRPLPSGQYEHSKRGQLAEWVPCDYYSVWRPTIVIVTPPLGALHEAFFDPAALGDAVGYEGSAGYLDPGGFVVNVATSTAITSLKWEKGMVSMALGPYVSLAGHDIDFIELDGSVGLNLSFDDAATDPVTGTYAWKVADQPWRHGDKLMIRIRGRDPALLPEGVVLEATLGVTDVLFRAKDAVGYDDHKSDISGVLTPAQFDAGGQTFTIHSLIWTSGSGGYVLIDLGEATLGGHEIELTRRGEDSPTLTFSFDDASPSGKSFGVEGRYGVGWELPDQPWVPGDIFKVVIRKTGN